MKFRSFLLFFCMVGANSYAQKANPATTPPMGWNSYNCFGSAVHENEVKANACYMAKYLKPYGWQYVVVDFLWSYDNPPGSNIGNPYQKNLQDGSFIPWLTMDKWGRLLPQTDKFPSAFGGHGFKPLAAYVHQLGLKFGIHVMRGIPRQAVWAKSPVLGTNGITADMIADTSSKCDWLNHMYGINMDNAGAQAYLNSLLKLYASWGVDFIKVDDIARPYHKKEIEGYRKAIWQCGRPIVLSISPGETPVSEAEHVTKNANMWRMADDFWDNWKEILHMFDYAKRWEGIGGKGHWPDCDMLQIGKLSKRGPVSNERYSRFTDDELYTHMTFWCIFRSPLMIGGNLPENRQIERKLFTNPEVLGVDQQGVDPKQLYKKEGSMVWYSHVPKSRDIYVALFNTGDTAQDVIIDFASIGLKGNIKVRNLWGKQNEGAFENTYTKTINRHGAALLRVTPPAG
ncbi:glycoside hydrolase family 27 protein [uncultured Mucilaginibacter sp.]|uniref:glycoside hydrolase family 27 protein n=1 Tax=uncultured Mucilaginibacter sp. TaxID=797541 RepID=UPI0025D1BFD5|nr:glycoside hydrolase family 27 protein [uncultured Mucilaginibacter sp.]